MPVALHAAADDLAFEYVESGEEGGGAIADIVVRHGAVAPLLDRQPRLCAIEGLDLALLIDREHHGMGRRIDIEAADLPELVGKGLVVGQLEPAHAMRLQPARAPDPLHPADPDAGRL